MDNYPNQNNYKHLVEGTDIRIPLSNGRYTNEINFDNAATTPPLKSVMEAINNFAPWYASIHRGTGYKSKLSSEFYENARKTIAKFIMMDMDYSTVIFVKNSTEALNKIAHKLGHENKGGIVLSSYMEHHSNDLPWRKYFRVKYIDLDTNGKLDIQDYEQKLRLYSGQIRLVAVSGASNVTGYKNDIHYLARLAHKYGTKILIDGAQLIPHSPINMQPAYDNEHIDYLVFSGHKIYAPFGTGVLIAPKKTFKHGPPTYVGGGTVKIVTPQYVMWDDVPYKEEAGTPNIMGVVALDAALKTLNRLDMHHLEEMELSLTQHALNKLNKIKDVIIYGNSKNCIDRIGIVTFNIKGLHHSIVANALSKEAGVSVRSGCFCAQPYVQKLLRISHKEMDAHRRNPNLPHPGMVRISFGLYNTMDEVDRCIDFIAKLADNKAYYQKKYPCHYFELSSSARY
ncbi:aminotransferase class V-fold PLP-dependent enzyme [Vallitalea pronyensis]|uniref:Aminotransferase class V-fold PLP-dependent enzyme n=1 Tax=Vallitalea pronyensis TaxID=1348613 RepID=A0A8J8MKJ7_9FIRM|nr:aminotransferase class V-fold PLP-dependent enzyme [Vallitalea pronyensis]QUI23552.1 aminotransferase class V-fold PLP-dependent enzyme [Vallitalea pronyensis]